MEYYGLQGGFRDSLLSCSDQVDAHCFCCVVFPFHDGITSCLHVHGNVPKCYPRMLWVVFISLLCMKNKIHIRLKGDQLSNTSRETTQNPNWENCPVGVSKENKGLVSMVEVNFLFNYLIIRSFSDELNTEMNLTISL